MSDDDPFGDDLDEDFLLEACEKAEKSEGTPDQPEKAVLQDDPGPGQSHLKVLRDNFGHPSFKTHQWDIISRILDNNDPSCSSPVIDHCVVMATGYGKSLLYQYPAVYLGRTSLVVSPLISLMEDQVQALNVAGIKACFLGSAQSDKETVYAEIRRETYR